MKKLIAVALVVGGIAGAAPAVADTTGRSGRGVENKSERPAPKPKVPNDFGQKISDAVHNLIR